MRSNGATTYQWPVRRTKARRSWKCWSHAVSKQFQTNPIFSSNLIRSPVRVEVFFSIIRLYWCLWRFTHLCLREMKRKFFRWVCGKTKEERIARKKPSFRKLTLQVQDWPCTHEEHCCGQERVKKRLTWGNESSIFLKAVSIARNEGLLFRLSK